MMLRALVFVSVLALSAAGQRSPLAEQQPLLPGSAQGASPIVMAPVTTEVGLDFVFTIGNTHTGGNTWVDYNNDYWPDLFVTNGWNIEHYLFRNNGDGTFTDVSSLVPKTDIDHEDAGVLAADFENDGDTDILVYVDNPFFAVAGNNPDDGGPDEEDGLLTETLTSSVATWESATQELTVSVRSSRGGRTSVDATSFGPLSWDPEQLLFESVFTTVADDPGSVTVTSTTTGASWVLPVTPL